MDVQQTNRKSYFQVLLFLIFINIANIILGDVATAQTITASDGTDTRLNQNGNQIDIRGGRRSPNQTNLFHSFDQFNLTSDQIANFLTDPSIQNILGRINGGSPSAIDGLIRVSNSNANLYLLNPSGIVFGPNARLDILGSFTATTATGVGFGDAWFNVYGDNNYDALIGNPNRLAFAAGYDAAIANYADLSVAPEQSLNLIGGSVINEGDLTATNGQVAIAAVNDGSLVRLSQIGSVLNLEIELMPDLEVQTVSTSLPQSVTDLPALLTGGDLDHATDIITTANGQVYLGGETGAIAQSGGITARSITLNGDQTRVSGLLDVSGESNFVAVGGQIAVLGEDITLTDATIDASGPSGGGVVLVGGGYRGGDDIRSATTTVIDQNSQIDVSAIDNGNGGQAIAWANDSTQFSGSVLARGGANGGDGGFVEISGRNTLNLGKNWANSIDISASFGASGTLLFDPNDIFILAGSAIAIDDSPTNNNVLFAGDISNFLETTGSLIIETTGTGGLGDVRLDNGAAIAWTSTNDLTINADRSIILSPDSSITSTLGDITLNANLAELATGHFIGIDVDEAIISSAGGTINLTGIGGVTGSGQHGIHIQSDSVLQNTTGDITIMGRGGDTNGSYSAGIVLEGGRITTTSGAIALNGTGGTGSGSNFGVYLIDDAQITTDIGSIVLTGQGGSSRSATANSGIEVTRTARIETTEEGAIALNGIAGNGTGTDYGLLLSAPITGRGNTSITLTGDAAGNDVGILQSGNISTGTGDITVMTDDWDTAAPGDVQSQGNLVIQPFNADTDIALLNANLADTLVLPPSLFQDFIADGFTEIQVGRLDSTGAVSVTTSMTVNDPVVIAGGASLETEGFPSTTWTITGGDSGNLNTHFPNSFAFENIGHLQGGFYSDTFAFADGVTFTGTISGNIDNSPYPDTLDYSASSSNVMVDVRQLSEIESLVGSTTAAASTLQSGDSANTWAIATPTTGEVNGISFEDFNQLIGGDKADTFTLADGVDFNGSVDGGLGDDTLDYSTFTTDPNVNLATLTGMETLIGSLNAPTSTLQGADTVNTWAIATPTTGAVNGTNFQNFNQLLGGSDRDTFAFADSVSFDGIIQAGKGTDTLDYSAFTTDPEINVANLIEMGGEVAMGSAIAPTSTFQSENTANTWAITGANQGTLNEAIAFQQFNQLRGGTDSDTFALNGGVTFAGTIDAAAGNLIVTSDATLDLRSIGDIHALGDVSLDATGNIWAGNIIAPGQRISIASATGDITVQSLITTDGVGGDVMLQAQRDVVMAAIASNGVDGNGGSVTISAGGNGTVEFIDATGGRAGRGGMVDVTVGDRLRLSGLDPLTRNSITTTGGSGNGTLTLRHGQLNFGIGDSTTSSTATTITSGDITLAAPQTIVGNFIDSNLQIFTTAAFPAPTPTPSPSFIPSSPLTSSPSPGLIPRPESISIATPPLISPPGATPDLVSQLTPQPTPQSNVTSTSAPASFLDSQLPPDAAPLASPAPTSAPNPTAEPTSTPVVSPQPPFSPTPQPGNTPVAQVGPPFQWATDISSSAIAPLSITPTSGSDAYVQPTMVVNIAVNLGAVEQSIAQEFIDYLGLPPSTLSRLPNFAVTTTGNNRNVAASEGVAPGQPSGSVNTSSGLAFSDPGENAIATNPNRSSSTLAATNTSELSLGNNSSASRNPQANDGRADADDSPNPISETVLNSGTAPAESSVEVSDSSGEPSRNSTTASTEIEESQDSAVEAGEGVGTSDATAFGLTIDSFSSDDQDHQDEDIAAQQDPTLINAQRQLKAIAQTSGIQPALIYAIFVGQGSGGGVSDRIASAEQHDDDQLALVLVTADGQPVTLMLRDITRAHVMTVAADMRSEIALGARRANSEGYLRSAQQLYDWLIAPLEAELQARNVDNIAFVTEPGLRSVPFAALHNGAGFLIEQYSIGMMPSLSLTNTEYNDLRRSEVLAMGVSNFETSELNPLPAVPSEVTNVAGEWWDGDPLLDENSTLDRLRTARTKTPYGIVHLATHADFQAGELSNSYIQLWDQKLRLDQLRDLHWHEPPVSLVILSACRTALGSEEAELGFAGLAVQAGANSAIASLWAVSDEGTLGLMSELYLQLQQTSTKAEALRQTQLAMLSGQLRVESGALQGVRQGNSLSLPPELAHVQSRSLAHPYFWSAFTLVGSPW